jgi:uncharacterized protein
MSRRELLKKRRSDILRLAKECGATNVRVFGSTVRLEDSEKSDIDILVSMEEGRSLLDLLHFEFELEDLLQQEVDVVSDGGLSPYIRDRILSEAQPI